MAVQRRNTKQRKLVLDAVRQSYNHPTADEIYNVVRAQDDKISRGTVYRNLNQLAKDGEIQKLEMPDGPDCFDHRLQRHYHAKCSRCGRVFDIEMDYMEDLAHRVKDAYGFAIDGHNLVFTGVCPTCQQNGTQPGPSK